MLSFDLFLVREFRVRDKRNLTKMVEMEQGISCRNESSVYLSNFTYKTVLKDDLVIDLPLLEKEFNFLSAFGLKNNYIKIAQKVLTRLKNSSFNINFVEDVLQVNENFLVERRFFKDAGVLIDYNLIGDRQSILYENFLPRQKKFLTSEYFSMFIDAYLSYSLKKNFSIVDSTVDNNQLALLYYFFKLHKKLHKVTSFIRLNYFKFFFFFNSLFSFLFYRTVCYKASNFFYNLGFKNKVNVNLLVSYKNNYVSSLFVKESFRYFTTKDSFLFRLESFLVRHKNMLELIKHHKIAYDFWRRKTKKMTLINRFRKRIALRYSFIFMQSFLKQFFVGTSFLNRRSLYNRKNYSWTSYYLLKLQQKLSFIFANSFYSYRVVMLPSKFRVVNLSYKVYLKNTYRSKNIKLIKKKKKFKKVILHNLFNLNKNKFHRDFLQKFKGIDRKKASRLVNLLLLKNNNKNSVLLKKLKKKYSKFLRYINKMQYNFRFFRPGSRFGYQERAKRIKYRPLLYLHYFKSFVNKRRILSKRSVIAYNDYNFFDLVRYRKSFLKKLILKRRRKKRVKTSVRFLIKKNRFIMKNNIVRNKVSFLKSYEKMKFIFKNVNLIMFDQEKFEEEYLKIKLFLTKKDLFSVDNFLYKNTKYKYGLVSFFKDNFVFTEKVLHVRYIFLFKNVLVNLKKKYLYLGNVLKKNIYLIKKKFWDFLKLNSKHIDKYSLFVSFKNPSLIILSKRKVHLKRKKIKLYYYGV